MNNLNSILIEGDIVADAVTKTLPSGTPVCTFSLASNRSYRTNDGFEKEVSFFDIQASAKTAELCADNAKKGRGLRIVGRLKQERWVNAKGEQMSKVIVVAEHVEFKPAYREKKPGNEDEACPDSDKPEVF